MELTNYEEWQLAKYGNIELGGVLFKDGTCSAAHDQLIRLCEWRHINTEQEFENGTDASIAFEGWMADEAERQRENFEHGRY